MRATVVTVRAEVSRRSEADQYLCAPGDAVIVRRGNLRSIAMACPDGCGENLTINLDPATGAAWRLYRRRRGLSLFPSVWRDTGCESHFIIWNNGILWCDNNDAEEPVTDEELEERVLSLLDVEVFKSFTEIADALDEIPWGISQVCRRLVRRGLVLRGPRKQADSYKLKYAEVK
jgi:hypothetical protein